MRIGVPKEIKDNENRVALTPAGARALTQAGHEVLVQSTAGLGSGISDADFAAAGARIVPNADDVWNQADMIIKVKEPLRQEYTLMRRDQVVFTYLHLAPEPQLTRAMLDSGVVGIAYETIQDNTGSLPCSRR